MHPGNILVRLIPAKASFKSRPHVIFLDVGMTAELSKRDRMNLLEFFKAVALRDGRTAAECTLRLSSRQSCPHPEAFIEVMLCVPYWMCSMKLIMIVSQTGVAVNIPKIEK